ncbi:MAG: acyl-CoA dehydrogenase family protein [Candidatus Rokubacteria bacterium]|nr:acyl-CoA dehydrogenase family protein [Candidatus Rokubacteria bacterium]
MAMPLADDKRQIVATIREFVDKEVKPVASGLEHADLYPHDLVARMKELGLFGSLIPEAYGGLGLNSTTYAMVIEELCRGWMSLAGVINSHTIAALIVLNHGTEEQRQRFLPRFASGEARGGLCLTEPHAGSDVQAIRTVARRRGDEFLITGTKMFVTNGREGNTFALLARTDPAADPPHTGMSCFIVEKDAPGLTVAKSISKLGYKGVDTAELVFEEFPVPARNLVGGVEGRGFKQVMSGLETGRINIAARAVGVAQAAFDDAVHHLRSQREEPRPALADMATKLSAARLLTYWAAGMKDRGERCDLEAGMAKLYASEAAQEIAVEAMRIHGEAGTLTSLEVERHYRDTPLMIIGEGTNEIQRLVIARNLLERYGEQASALTSLEGLPDERKQMVLAVRQFVEKHVVPVVHESERARRYPAEIVETLGDLGILGATVPPEHGGLGLDFTTYAMILEELARGWTTLAAIVSGHLTVAHLIARSGTAEQRKRLLPAMARGELTGCAALTGAVTARRAGRDWVLNGTIPAVDDAAHGALLAVLARTDRERSACFLVERSAKGLTLSGRLDTLGARGLDTCEVHLKTVRVSGPALAADGAVLALARLGIAATAVGLAQAAFQAALRYSQQRSAFGKPICQHQAIQLTLADMATALTTARLLTHSAAARQDAGEPGDLEVGMAKIHASETAYEVTLEAMRIHGGYGYTTEFPVERFYRDAPHLMLNLGGNDRERVDLSRRLVQSRAPA